MTHYLFRYPAKFHPPVVRELLDRYSAEDDTVLDPFCGSGTLLVEAATLDRRAIGSDVDPLAVFVSRVKTRRVTIRALRASSEVLLDELQSIARTAAEYERRQFRDISESTYRRNVRDESLEIPAIPNLFHWFRRYAIIDLARIRHAIEELDVSQTHRQLFLLCFASIVRGASNADPVPVSGLEVTAHMKRRDKAGRIVDPFKLFRSAIVRGIDALSEYVAATTPGTAVKVMVADATDLTARVQSHVDVVITSPPYHHAVDYYRRHTLEMYWLDLVGDHEARLRLLPRYIGRARVSPKHPFVAGCTVHSRTAASWERRIRKVDHVRADAFKHYVVAMSRCLEQLATLLPTDQPAVFVLGESSCNGAHIPMVRMFEELAQEYFELGESFWYPLKNRYMSYSRRNGASIDKDYVLVFRRR